MPRGPRKRGESGFYHVVSKGNGGQIIFEGEDNRLRYLRYLEKATRDYKVSLHAYCLMSNHVHLLVQDDGFALGNYMKQLNESYANYFRAATGRVGRLFQSPYWSEPIESDEYFLSALRYIHANPEPAGICRANEYPWSSYRAHLGSGNDTFVTIDFTRELLGGVREFEEFSAPGGKFAIPFPHSRLRSHLGPDEMTRIAIDLLGRDAFNTLKMLPVEQRQEKLAILHKSGFTESEITRITGIGKGSVHYALAS